MALEQISTPKIIKVVIFWDYENVSFKSANLIQFLKNIPSVERNICKRYNASNNHVEYISLKRVFADWTKICAETQNMIRDAGFELIQVPNTGKNSSDNGLKRNAREIIKLIQPNVFLLISVDGDYIDLLNEQKRAGIFRAFIGREHSVSRDLKEVVDLYYFVESEGKIFEYTKITKESAIQIIENAVEDAYAALKNLEKDSNPETLCIFPFSQWRDAFARLETFKNPNLALYQIIGLKDLFKIMAQRYGIAHSFDYEWICSKPLFTEKSIQEILVQNPEYNINEPKDVISSLLPLDEKEIEKIFKELACPNKEPKQELQRNIINNTQATEAKDNSKCAEAKEIKEKIPSSISNKKEEEKEAQYANDRKARKKYLENLADLILNSFNLEKIAKRNLLAISDIDNAYKKQNFGTTTMKGKEHYKKFGYSKFSKAVDDAVSLLNQRSDLNKKFVIIKNSMQNYIKCQ